MGRYTIKAGKHYSRFHVGVTFGKKVAYKCMFNESCLYDLESNDNYDINKLCGFSTKYNHHYQSARIGWRCVDGKTIEIVTYTYNDHSRLKEIFLGHVLPNEEFECSIEDVETAYVYKFRKDGSEVTVRTPKHPDKVIFKYLLFPYFGGNIPSPHHMVMYVDRIKSF